MSEPTPSHCQICDVPFRRTLFQWTIRGQKAWICPKCNAACERRKSAAAFGKDVEYPPILAPKFNVRATRPKSVGRILLLLVVLSITGVGLYQWLSNADRTVLTSPSRVQEAQLEPSSAKVPLFRNPLAAIHVPVELGLNAAEGRTPEWRKAGNLWTSTASIQTFDAHANSDAALDGRIVCKHVGQFQNGIDEVIWSALIPSPDRDKVTANRFKQLCLAYCERLGCKVPPDLFANVNPAIGQSSETESATFELRQLQEAYGFRWELSIKSK